MSTGSLPPLDILGLLPGADPELAPDPYEFLYRLPPSPPALPAEAGLPPAPPSYAAPETLPVPPLGFMDRFATSLAGVPQFSGPMPAEGTGGAFVRGLLGGAAGGISRSGAERMKRAETNRAETNATRKSEADRNYAAATETWRAKIKAYYRAMDDPETPGRMILTPQMVEDARLPKESVGTPMGAKEYADRLERVRGLLPSGAVLPPKPKPAPKPPKAEAAGEMRRKVIAAITVENGNDPVRIRAYLNRAGVLKTLAEKYGITQAEVLRAVPG